MELHSEMLKLKFITQYKMKQQKCFIQKKSYITMEYITYEWDARHL